MSALGSGGVRQLGTIQSRGVILSGWNWACVARTQSRSATISTLWLRRGNARRRARGCDHGAGVGIRGKERAHHVAPPRSGRCGAFGEQRLLPLGAGRSVLDLHGEGARREQRVGHRLHVPGAEFEGDG